jgi:hypothetical protein
VRSTSNLTGPRSDRCRQDLANTRTGSPAGSISITVVGNASNHTANLACRSTAAATLSDINPNDYSSEEQRQAKGETLANSIGLHHERRMMGRTPAKSRDITTDETHHSHTRFREQTEICNDITRRELQAQVIPQSLSNDNERTEATDNGSASIKSGLFLFAHDVALPSQKVNRRAPACCPREHTTSGSTTKHLRQSPKMVGDRGEVQLGSPPHGIMEGGGERRLRSDPAFVVQ